MTNKRERGTFGEDVWGKDDGVAGAVAGEMWRRNDTAKGGTARLHSLRARATTLSTIGGLTNLIFTRRHTNDSYHHSDNHSEYLDLELSKIYTNIQFFQMGE